MQEDIINKQTGISSFMKKKSVIGLLFGIILIILAGVYFVTDMSYKNSKEELIDEQAIDLTTWVNSTVSSVELWANTLNEEAQRVSTSDFYRLFIQDIIAADLGAVANNLDSQTGQSSSIKLDSTGDESLIIAEVPEFNLEGVIDAEIYSDDNLPPNAHIPAAEKDEVELFAAQIPLVRNTLYDYVNYNGFTDARFVDAKGTTLLSAMQRPAAITDAQLTIAQNSIRTNSIAFAPIRPSAAGMLLDFAVPVLPLFAESSSEPIASLVFTMPVLSQMAQFMSRDMRTDNTFQPQIVQLSNGNYQLLSITSPTPIELSEALELDHDTFGLPFANRMSVDGKSAVYSYGRKVHNMDTWVILEIPATLLEAKFKSLAWTIYGLGFLVAVGILLLLALLWWVMIGNEQRAVADKFKNLYSLLAEQKNLLDSINMSLQVGLILVDTHGRIPIFNKAFAELVKRDEAELEDISLMTVFSGQVAGEIMEHIHNIQDQTTSRTFEVEIPDEDELIILCRVTIYPVQDVNNEGELRGAVATFQDITEFRRNSERNKKQQESIIKTFTRAIEGIDPYLTGHSQMMSNLGVLICKQMRLTEEDEKIVRDASLFCQLGKLFIPREILHKTEKLSPEESAVLRQIPDKAYEVLSSTGFSAPIAMAVREMNEQMDGKGYPQQLKGSQITVHARILAITNAFCAMISDRAFRKGLSSPDALNRLKDESNRFDSYIVDCLTAVLQTHEGANALILDEEEK